MSTAMTPEEALALVRYRLEEIDEELRKGATKAWLRTAIGDVWRYLNPGAEWGQALLSRGKVLAEGLVGGWHDKETNPRVLDILIDESWTEPIGLDRRVRIVGIKEKGE
jgi:hypothetical protein